jgi:hypothetical protein
MLESQHQLFVLLVFVSSGGSSVLAIYGTLGHGDKHLMNLQLQVDYPAIGFIALFYDL